MACRGSATVWKSVRVNRSGQVTSRRLRALRAGSFAEHRRTARLLGEAVSEPPAIRLPLTQQGQQPIGEVGVVGAERPVEVLRTVGGNGLGCCRGLLFRLAGPVKTGWIGQLFCGQLLFRVGHRAVEVDALTLKRLMLGLLTAVEPGEVGRRRAVGPEYPMGLGHIGAGGQTVSDSLGRAGSGHRGEVLVCGPLAGGQSRQHLPQPQPLRALTGLTVVAATGPGHMRTARSASRSARLRISTKLSASTASLGSTVPRSTRSRTWSAGG